MHPRIRAVLLAEGHAVRSTDNIYYRRMQLQRNDIDGMWFIRLRTTGYSAPQQFPCKIIAIMSGRSGTALYSNAFHAPIIRRHPRPGSNLTGHAESGLRATGDAFPLVPDVDDNLIGTQKEPGLKDRGRARGAVLLVPAIWAAPDRPSSLSPVPTVICHCDELSRAAGSIGIRR